MNGDSVRHCNTALVWVRWYSQTEYSTTSEWCVTVSSALLHAHSAPSSVPGPTHPSSSWRRSSRWRATSAGKWRRTRRTRGLRRAHAFVPMHLSPCICLFQYWCYRACANVCSGTGGSSAGTSEHVLSSVPVPSAAGSETGSQFWV